MKHPNATTLLKLYSVLAAALLFSGCASARKNPLLSQAPDSAISKKDFLKKSHEADRLWNDRNESQSLSDFIRLEEELSRSRLQTKERLVRLARAHYIRAEYDLDGESARADEWDLGADWAEKALAENRCFRRKVVDRKMPPDQALSCLNARDADALYWFASNLGRWASKQGLSTILKYKDRVKKMIDRVRELSPNYLYGGIYRYYGVYYALIPGYTDENLKKSRKYFETALKKYPEYFSNHVLYAQYYAAKVGDDSLFKKHLSFVAKENPKNISLKDAYPEQLLEQNRAKLLLKENPAP